MIKDRDYLFCYHKQHSFLRHETNQKEVGECIQHLKDLENRLYVKSEKIDEYIDYVEAKREKNKSEI